MDEQKISEQIKEFEKLADQDKSIDLAALTLTALEQQEKNRISGREKRIAYFISIGFPPFGLIFAVKFWLSDKDGANASAIWCVVLTVLSILLYFLFVRLLFSSSGMTYDQFKETPDQLRQLLQ